MSATAPPPPGQRPWTRSRPTRLAAAIVVAAVFALLATSSSALTSAEVAPQAPGTIRAAIGHPLLGNATSWPIARASFVGVSTAGDIYFSQEERNRVLKVDAASGDISLAAGIGDLGDFGDGGPATSAGIESPEAVAGTGTDRFYFVSLSGPDPMVHVVDEHGVIQTIAGSKGYDRIAADAAGDLFMSNGKAIKKVTPAGAVADMPISHPGSDVQLLAASENGDLYYVDESGSQITKVGGETGTISFRDASSLGGWPSFGALAADNADNVYIGLTSSVWTVPGTGPPTLLAGSTTSSGYSGDDGPANAALLTEVEALAVDGSSRVYINDFGDRIRMVDQSKVISTVAGTGRLPTSKDGTLATAAFLDEPDGLAIEATGNVLIYDRRNFQLRRLLPDGSLTTVAGPGPGAPSPDFDLPAPALQHPVFGHIGGLRQSAVAEGSDGTIYLVSDAELLRISNGVIDFFAGFLFPDDLDSQLHTIGGLAVDRLGRVYVSDEDNNRVLRFDAPGVGVVVAGAKGNPGTGGDGGPATSAQLSDPSGLAIDDAGNLYIADHLESVIRRVDPSGIITTVAGKAGAFGFDGDGPATARRLFAPNAIAVDGKGNLYIADQYNAMVRRVSPGGYLSTLAGQNSFGFAGDGGPARDALLTNPVALAVDHDGQFLYVADESRDVVRRIALEAPFVPVQPTRVLDTRSGVGTAAGKVPKAGTVEVSLSGVAGIPADASAVVLNVTATEPEAPGYLTVYPCGSAPPLASNLNYAVGQNVPNLVIARLGAAGKVCIYTYATTHIVADVSGVFPAEHAYQPLNPVRVVDTRAGVGAPAAKVRANGLLTVDVTGNGVAKDARAVVVNVTATDAGAPGYLTVYPCDQPRPLASNVNYVAGQNVPNLVTAAVSPTGTICIYSLAATDVIVDVNGWYPRASAYEAVSPIRILDTRDGTGTDAAGQVPASGTVVLHVAGVNGVPDDAKAAVLNVTVTEPEAAGFVTVYPCGQPQPLASNLNYAAGQNVPNLVTAPIGANGDVCLYTMSATHLVADLNGWHPA
jgi:sugar lactone lactonase YvrE